MFVGRERELSKLNKMYQGGCFEFAVVYGRRRVGKTTLIQEFMKDKQGYYYMSVEGAKKENLAGLSRAFLSNKDSLQENFEFRDYESMLAHIDTLAKRKDRLIVAIDEYPYLAASYPVISSMLQSHIDNCWKESKLFLILCGSSMSFMEEQVLGYKSPLYGRRTAQFKIQPFTFFEARQMLEGYQKEEQAVFYGVTGGIPEYLSHIQGGISVHDNIVQLFFDESGRLFEEPLNLMKQELKEPMTYHSIISAIAGGASRLNEIASKTGLETSGCSNQLVSLISLGIIKKEIPIAEPETSRRTIYRLADSMYLFWYRFVRPNTSGIIRGAGTQIYESSVLPQMNDFMGQVFEEICIQYLFQPSVYKHLLFPAGKIGRWWGNNPKTKRQEEIDLMAVCEDRALFGECKWRNEKTDVSVVKRLLERGDLFAYRQKQFYVFSKAGFSQDTIEFSKICDNVRLVDFDEMVF
ncbi:MAG: ATP-binding protein [Lachnospiraceae bacterium]|nr:ATP-binding protein [Lachnospiraceae bacterium]